ncbi:MAG TPA: hypothetical protein VE988_25290 [Gemmataceae bacterium]|nr:hypothetical protein [Gemmataceae bacterium]
MNTQQQAALTALANLTELGKGCAYGGDESGIQLFQCGITDADMRHFAILPEFESINLGDNAITDAGLEFLRGQTKLRFLDISNSGITRLDALRWLTALHTLCCDRIDSLDDDGAAALEFLTNLQFLRIFGTEIGDATLSRLANHRHLKALDLTWTKVTDDGLRHLASIRDLEKLGLYGTAISDKGLMHLHGLVKLRQLMVGETQITKRGEEQIKQAIPGVVVGDNWDIPGLMQ